MTRFSKDYTVVDFFLPQVLVFGSIGLFRTITVTASVFYLSPLLIPISMIGILFMVWYLNLSLRPMCEVEKLEGIKRGPIHSGLTNLTSGLVSLRAMNRVSYYQQEFMDHLEISSNLSFMMYQFSLYLAIHLELVCMVFIFCVSLFVLLAKDSDYLESDYLAFILQSLTDVIVFFSISFRMMAGAANCLTSS